MLDVAGRVRRSRTEHPGSTGGWTGTQVYYDILGRVAGQSVPTEINSSYTAAGDDATRGFIYNYQYYDWKGRVTRTIPSDSNGYDGKDTLITYDGCGCAGGQVTTIQGPLVPRDDQPTVNARRTQKVYEDILGRTWKTVAMKWDGTTAYLTSQSSFNGRDQAISVTQTNENSVVQTTSMSYDGHGRLKTRHNPIEEANTQTTWTYNADDSVATVTDPRGAVVTYSYGNPSVTEKRSLLLGVAYAPPSPQPSYTTIPDTADVTFSYDNLGNRTAMTDGSGSTSYSYDERSRLTSETKSFAGLSGNFTLTYGYQISGKLKSITDPFGADVYYNDDKTGRTTSITGADFLNVATYASDIKYRAFGGVKELTYGSADSSHITYGYDSGLRISSYQATSNVLSGGYVRKASYEYFNDGQTKKVNNLLDSGFDQNYTYDSIGRLSTSASGTKTNSQSQQVTPFAQSIGYTSFGDMTSRSTDVWGGDSGFTATYTNGRKQNSNEIFDAAGNIVDGTVTSTVYNRWKFDASGRNVETVMRWYQSASSPQLDRTETITKTFDGDGLDTKRVDTKVITQYPANTTSTTSEVEYYVRSSVLGGKTVTELDASGGKKLTKVYTGDAVLAEQRVTSGVGAVYWRHEDLVTGSYRKIDANGNEGGSTSDSPANVEYEPLGGSIPQVDPTGDLALPSTLRQFKYAGDVNRSEYGCEWNGAPMRCDMISFALRSSTSTEIFVNTRTAAGGILYSTLQSMVSLWRYDVRQVVDQEDRRITPAMYKDKGLWDRPLGNGKYGFLLGSFYVAYLSEFAEMVISHSLGNWDHTKYFDTPDAGGGLKYLNFRNTQSAGEFLKNALAGDCGTKIAALINKFAEVTGVAARTTNLATLFNDIASQRRGGFLLNIPPGDNLYTLVTSELRQYYGSGYNPDVGPGLPFGLATRLLTGNLNIGGRQTQFNGEALVYLKAGGFRPNTGSYQAATFLLTNLIHELVHVAASSSNLYNHDSNEKLLDAVKGLGAASVNEYIAKHCRPR